MAILLGVLGTHGVPDEQSGTGKPTQAVERVPMKDTDCLWYTARNHGFYWIQRKVALKQADKVSKTLWTQFVESTGVAECGLQLTSMGHLETALEVSVEAADNYFMSTR